MKKLLLVTTCLVAMSMEPAFAQNATKALDEGAGNPVIKPIEQEETKPQPTTQSRQLPYFGDYSTPESTSFNLWYADEHYDRANKVFEANLGYDTLSCMDLSLISDLYSYAAEQYEAAGIEDKARIANERNNAIVGTIMVMRHGSTECASVGPDVLVNYKRWFPNSSKPPTRSTAESLRDSLRKRLGDYAAFKSRPENSEPHLNGKALRLALKQAMAKYEQENKEKEQENKGRDISGLCAYMKRVGYTEFNGVVTSRDCIGNSPILRESRRQPEGNANFNYNTTPGGVTGGVNTGPANPSSRGGSNVVPSDPNSHRSTIKGPIRSDHLDSGGPTQKISKPKFLGGASSPPPNNHGGIRVGGQNVTGSPADLSEIMNSIPDGDDAASGTVKAK